jgi:hypothetical protein
MVPFEKQERLAPVPDGICRYEVQKKHIVANVARNSVVLRDERIPQEEAGRNAGDLK